jgi:hypothetical protein
MVILSSISMSVRVFRAGRNAHIDCVIPMLRSSVLEKTRRCLDSIYCPSNGQNELFELRQEVRCPSVRCVDNCLCANSPSFCLDLDPTLSIALLYINDWCVCMETQVTRLEEYANEGMYKLVRPSETRQKLATSKNRVCLTFDQQDALLPPGRPSSACSLLLV